MFLGPNKQLLVLGCAVNLLTAASSFVTSPPLPTTFGSNNKIHNRSLLLFDSAAAAADNAKDEEQTTTKTATTTTREASSSPEFTKAPTFNGKVTLPMKVVSAGLKGHCVAAVYAVFDNNYKRGAGEGWSFCQHVGVTFSLDDSLSSHLQDYGPEIVAHVRALSFAYPQRTAMEEVANRWREQAIQAGGMSADWTNDATETLSLTEDQRLAIAQKVLFEGDDDDSDDEDDDWNSMDAAVQTFKQTSKNDDIKNEIVTSPFSEKTSPLENNADIVGSSSPILVEFNKENVDKILDDVRPYLISDGGNVSVQSVDLNTKNVYLVLEGACGSCASSTVTMQMGIERILKETFPDLGEVIQVQDDAQTDAAKPTELTHGAVREELRRIQPAITAMGGVVDIVSVDAKLGVVELRFRGSNRIRQGLELAVRDVPFVRHVQFVS